MRNSPWTEEQLYERLMDLRKGVWWWRRGRQPQPATEEDVANVERALKVRFPPEYRRYLLNYAHIRFRGFQPFRVGELVEAVAAARAIGVPEYLLPFCPDFVKNYFCFDSRAEGEWPVAYWDRDGRYKHHRRYESFVDWLERCCLADV